MHVVYGLLEGRSVDSILAGIRLKQMQGKKELMREAIRNSLDPASIQIIKDCLSLIDAINKEIEELDKEINRRFQDKKLGLEIAMSMPGVGFVSACTLLAG